MSDEPSPNPSDELARLQRIAQEIAGEAMFVGYAFRKVYADGRVERIPPKNIISLNSDKRKR